MEKKNNYKFKLSSISMLNKKKYLRRKTCKTEKIEKNPKFLKGLHYKSQYPFR